MNHFYLLILLSFTLPLTGQNDPIWDVLITDARIFTGSETLTRSDLALKDGEIVALGPELDRQQRATVKIDAQGKTIIPGLLNAHVHTWFPAHLQMAAQAGVLGVCDMHGSAFAVQLLSQFNDSIGYADYHAAGPGATVPKGHGTQFGMIVPTIDSTTSARQFVLDRAKEGVDYIKILREPLRPTLTYEQIDTVIRTAHELGLKAVAHVSRCEDGVALARMGVDGLVHIWFDRPMTDTELEVFAARDDLFVVPTALTNMGLLKFLKEQGREAGDALDSVQLLREIGRLHAAGVDILADTDPPNFNINYGTDLYKELGLLAAAGIPLEDCFAGATAKAAEHFSIAKQHRIQLGVPASFLLVNGNPLENVEDLNQLEQVWHDGNVIFDARTKD